MPKGVRATPCEVCGSTGTNCASSAEHKAKLAGKKPAPAKPLPTAPRSLAEVAKRRPRVVRTSSDLPPLYGLSVEELVELRRQIDGELKNRRDKALSEVHAIEEAMGAPEAPERAAS